MQAYVELLLIVCKRQKENRQRAERGAFDQKRERHLDIHEELHHERQPEVADLSLPQQHYPPY